MKFLSLILHIIKHTPHRRRQSKFLTLLLLFYSLHKTTSLLLSDKWYVMLHVSFLLEFNSLILFFFLCEICFTKKSHHTLCVWKLSFFLFSNKKKLFFFVANKKKPVWAHFCFSHCFSWKSHIKTFEFVFYLLIFNFNNTFFQEYQEFAQTKKSLLNHLI